MEGIEFGEETIEIPKNQSLRTSFQSKSFSAIPTSSPLLPIVYSLRQSHQSFVEAESYLSDIVCLLLLGVSDFLYRYMVHQSPHFISGPS